MLLKFAFAQLGMVSHIWNLRGSGEKITNFLYSITLSYSNTYFCIHVHIHTCTHICSHKKLGSFALKGMLLYHSLHLCIFIFLYSFVSPEAMFLYTLLKEEYWKIFVVEVSLELTVQEESISWSTISFQKVFRIRAKPFYSLTELLGFILTLTIDSTQ